MSCKRYKGVIFDLDGTLLDTVGDLTYSINLTMKSLGYPTHTKDEVRSFINDGAKKLIERALPCDKRDEESISYALSVYLANYNENVCIETAAYDGITDLVKRLKDEGYILSVVSNKPKKQLETLCGIFFGKDTFCYLSGTGEGLPSKPAKECAELALSAMGLSSGETVFVGDSHVDVKTAHNADMKCVGVTWGFHGKDGFKDETCDFTAHNTNELYDIISMQE